MSPPNERAAKETCTLLEMHLHDIPKKDAFASSFSQLLLLYLIVLFLLKQFHLQEQFQIPWDPLFRLRHLFQV